MKITGLSLDSQLAILNQVFSHTLLTSVPLVCAQWNQLQPHACLTRRTVKLSIYRNTHLPGASRHFLLYPASFNAPYVTALLATLPNVTHLDIRHDNGSLQVLDPMLYLLQGFTPTLLSFSLYIDEAFLRNQLSPQINDFQDRLLVLLNQMSRLKCLKLTASVLSPSANLSFLHRLVDVELNFGISEHLVSQLLQHCSPNLQRLSLGPIDKFANFVPLLSNASICSKLERLKITTNSMDLTQLVIIFDHCTNLQTLHFSPLILVQYVERMHLLSKLPRLTELILTLWQVTDPIEPVFSSALPVLPSIRRLIIFLQYISSHEHFVQATQLSEVFPQLQKIQLVCFSSRSIGCQQCTTNGRHPDSCIDTILRPLGRLETLQVAHVLMVRNNSNFYNWLPRLRRQ